MATCTWENFLQNSTLLLEISRQQDVSWSWVDAQDGRFYLSAARISNTQRESQDSALSSDTLTELMLEEDAACVACPSSGVGEMVRFEYHILYSDSYQQPVLFFNAHRQDGRLLSLEEIWSLVPDVYRERLSRERWTMVTQQEHPILHRPYFTIHPCHTDQLMAQIPQTRNYLVSWLSVFGPLIGLNLPLTYATLT